MPRFRYTALDVEGLQVSGDLDAPSQQDAVTQLEANGLRVERIESVDGDSLQDKPMPILSFDDEPQPEQRTQPVSSADKLSPRELEQVTGRISEIAVAELPLASGLRAVAEEIPSRRLRRVLTAMSERLDAGDALDAVLKKYSLWVPQHLRGLLAASVETGNLGLMMDQYLTYVRRNQEMRRKIWLSLSYSIALLAASLGICYLLFHLVVGELADVFMDFDLELPGLTVWIVSLANVFNRWGGWVLLGALLLAFGIWRGLGALLGQAARKRLLDSVPFFGTLLRYASLARFCQLLAILVENEVRLPKALRVVAAGASDPNIREGCNLLADDVEHGMPLADAAVGLRNFPASLVNIFRWERREKAFPDALHAAADIFSARTDIQTGMIGLVLEPLILISVAVFVGVVVIAMFMPLIKLLNALS